jgi:hypothetical protein
MPRRRLGKPSSGDQMLCAALSQPSRFRDGYWCRCPNGNRRTVVRMGFREEQTRFALGGSARKSASFPRHFSLSRGIKRRRGTHCRSRPGGPYLQLRPLRLYDPAPPPASRRVLDRESDLLINRMCGQTHCGATYVPKRGLLRRFKPGTHLRSRDILKHARSAPGR